MFVPEAGLFGACRTQARQFDADDFYRAAYRRGIALHYGFDIRHHDAVREHGRVGRLFEYVRVVPVLGIGHLAREIHSSHSLADTLHRRKCAIQQRSDTERQGVHAGDGPRELKRINDRLHPFDGV